jgi:hypothetical protein
MITLLAPSSASVTLRSWRPLASHQAAEEGFFASFLICAAALAIALMAFVDNTGCFRGMLLEAATTKTR